MKQDEKWSSLIGAVKTPLGFMVFAVLVLNALLGAISVAVPAYRIWLGAVLIGSIFLVVATVVLLAIFRPEALMGTRPWHETYAPKLADDLFMAVEGAFANLEQKEREEAWTVLSDVLTNVPKDEKNYRKFCLAVESRIQRNLTLRSRVPAPRSASRSDAGVQ